MGTVPGQMAKMRKTAKKEANRKRKEGFRGGEGPAQPSPQSCLEEDVRSCGKCRKYRNSSHPRKGRPLGFHFTREKEGHDMEARIGLITSTHADVVTQAYHNQHTGHTAV